MQCRNADDSAWTAMLCLSKSAIPEFANITMGYFEECCSGRYGYDELVAMAGGIKDGTFFDVSDAESSEDID